MSTKSKIEISHETKPVDDDWKNFDNHKSDIDTKAKLDMLFHKTTTTSPLESKCTNIARKSQKKILDDVDEMTKNLIGVDDEILAEMDNMKDL